MQSKTGGITYPPNISPKFASNNAFPTLFLQLPPSLKLFLLKILPNEIKRADEWMKQIRMLFPSPFVSCKMYHMDISQCALQKFESLKKFFFFKEWHKVLMMNELWAFYDEWVFEKPSFQKLYQVSSNISI